MVKKINFHINKFISQFQGKSFIYESDIKPEIIIPCYNHGKMKLEIIWNLLKNNIL